MGCPVSFADAAAYLIMKGVILSHASISSSGYRYISIMMPLVPLRPSPITSKGALESPPEEAGKPFPNSLLLMRPITVLHRSASCPASCNVERALRISSPANGSTAGGIMGISCSGGGEGKFFLASHFPEHRGET